MKVHLVDGTYELFRSYFGAPSATSPAGLEMGAVRGLLRTLLALLRDPSVTHVACAFDSTVESFRNELFDGYKTGEGMEPELFGQFPFAERAARALGVVVWSMVEFEADDAIATGAKRYLSEGKVDQVVLCSPDKDLAQCVVGDRVVLWDRRREQVFDEDGVFEKFGVRPVSIPDYLALVGDAADGIPGIPKWGAKSASRILAAYDRLENIPTDAATWSVKLRGAAALSMSLESHRPEAALYRDLATLRTDVPLPETLQDLEYRGADRLALVAFCEEIGDTRFPSRVSRFREGPGA
ncbi:MAG: flap endonuclease [Myxococcales bacterium]|nr:flap endonuclease [Myxococcales bacterium]